MKKVMMKVTLLVFITSFITYAQMPASRKPKSDEEKIASALQGGPKFVAQNATVLDYPTSPGGEFRVLRAGKNGWTCLPGPPAGAHDEPGCFDQVFLQFIKDSIAGRTPNVRSVGISYMYGGFWVPNKSHAMGSGDDPAGIDVYFENVGGAIWQAVLPLLNKFARVPVSGLVAQYNGPGPGDGTDRLPATMREILSKSLTVRGFINYEFAEQHYAEFLREVGAAIADGHIRYREDIVDHLERAPEAFIGMLDGQNFGKVIVRVAAT
jgi:Zinc-binding dehydrogenase